MDVGLEKKIELLEWQRDNALRLRCPLVAKKYQRMIDELARKAETMKPKKDLIKAAEADGSIDRLNSLLSAAHILNCEANMLVEEAADLMNAKGLLLGNLKRLHNSFVKSADMYFLEFSSLVETEKSKMDMFRDMDDFDAKFREWAKLPSDWKPKESEE